MFPQTWRCSFSGFQSWIGELLRQLNDEPGETDSVAEQAGFEPSVPRGASLSPRHKEAGCRSGISE